MLMVFLKNSDFLFFHSSVISGLPRDWCGMSVSRPHAYFKIHWAWSHAEAYICLSSHFCGWRKSWGESSPRAAHRHAAGLYSDLHVLSFNYVGVGLCAAAVAFFVCSVCISLPPAASCPSSQAIGGVVTTSLIISGCNRSFSENELDHSRYTIKCFLMFWHCHYVTKTSQ